MCSYRFDIRELSGERHGQETHDCDNRSDVETHVRKILARLIDHQKDKRLPLHVDAIDPKNMLVMTATAIAADCVRFTWI